MKKLYLIFLFLFFLGCSNTNNPIEMKQVGLIPQTIALDYLNTNNYDEAIEALEKSNFSDLNVKNQYQKICFHRAVQLFNDGFYDQAIIYFKKSSSVKLINDLLTQTYYWIAESYYNLNMFQKINTKNHKKENLL